MLVVLDFPGVPDPNKPVEGGFDTGVEDPNDSVDGFCAFDEDPNVLAVGVGILEAGCLFPKILLVVVGGKDGLAATLGGTISASLKFAGFVMLASLRVLAKPLPNIDVFAPVDSSSGSSTTEEVSGLKLEDTLNPEEPPLNAPGPLFSGLLALAKGL